MTRQEEIWKAIFDLQIGDYDENKPPKDDIYDGSDIQSAFCKGAEWADEHPKSLWISVKDDLPCNYPNNIHFGFTNKVIATDGENIFTLYMKKCKDNKWLWCGDDCVDISHIITHWMPFPKPPKK